MITFINLPMIFLIAGSTQCQTYITIIQPPRKCLQIACFVRKCKKITNLGSHLANPPIRERRIKGYLPLLLEKLAQQNADSFSDQPNHLIVSALVWITADKKRKMAKKQIQFAKVLWGKKLS